MTSFFPMLFIIIKSEGLKDAEMGSCAEAFHISICGWKARVGRRRIMKIHPGDAGNLKRIYCVCQKRVCGEISVVLLCGIREWVFWTWRYQPVDECGLSEESWRKIFSWLRYVVVETMRLPGILAFLSSRADNASPWSDVVPSIGIFVKRDNIYFDKILDIA